MRPVPVSPIRFGDTLAADVAAARPLSLEEAHAVFEKASRVGPLFGSRESPKPRMRATPIWAALAFGVAAWVVLAGVVYAAWTWL